MGFDITSKKTVESIPGWRDEFIGSASPDQPDSFPFLVLGNKSDLEDERQVPTKLAERVCQKLGNLSFLECSAKENENVVNAFRTVASKVLARREDNIPLDYGRRLSVLDDP